MPTYVTFQSATPATAPANTKVAVDNDGTGDWQYVKMVFGADGTRTPVSTANPLPISDNGSTLSIDDGGGSITVDGTLTTTSAVKSRIQVSSAGLTTASTAYIANDQLGTILEFTSAVATSGGYGTIIGATLLDKAKIVGAVSLYLFDRSVTLATDNAQADFSDSDMLNWVGTVEFPPPSLANASASNGGSQVEPIALPYKCNATSLFGALVTRAGHTFFGAAGDLVVSLIVETS